MRISTGLRVAVAAACVLAAAVTPACTSTIDGAATCPGCGTGTEPEFPTTRPTPTPTTGETKPTRPGSDTATLEPNDAGYVYIETRSGRTRCQISADTVGCESEFTDAPSVNGEQATGVEVSATGSNRWVVGNLGAMPTVTIDYQVYRAVGWTIDAGEDGTRFTNDSTGHGMFVSIEQVQFF